MSAPPPRRLEARQEVKFTEPVRFSEKARALKDNWGVEAEPTATLRTLVRRDVRRRYDTEEVWLDLKKVSNYIKINDIGEPENLSYAKFYGEAPSERLLYARDETIHALEVGQPVAVHVLEYHHYGDWLLLYNRENPDDKARVPFKPLKLDGSVQQAPETVLPDLIDELKESVAGAVPGGLIDELREDFPGSANTNYRPDTTQVCRRLLI